MSQPGPRAHIEGIVSIAVMGSVPVAIKWVSVDPWVIGIIRLVIATSLLVLIFPAARQWRGLSRKDWLTLLLIGVVFGLHWITYFYAIKLSSASIASIGTISMYGIFLSLLGAVFLSHRVRWYHGAAIALSIIGVFLVVGKFDTGSGMLIGFLTSIASGFLYALLPILHQRATHMSSMLRTFGQYSGALVVFLIGAPLGTWKIPPMDWLGLVYLAIIGTLASHTLWVHATSVLPATTSSLLYYLYVPIAVLLSFLFLGETLALPQIIGGVIIISASLLGILGDQLLSKRKIAPVDD